MVSGAWFPRWLAILVSVLLALVLPLTEARAHVTDTTSARVILRAGQVEVHILTNAEHWQATLSSSESWLLGDTDTLMPEKLSDSQKQAFLQQLVRDQTRLLVNGRALAFDRVSISHPEDSEDMEIIVLARHSFPRVEKLSVSFPDSLGSVHLSVVQPEYRVLSPGDAAEVSL